MMTWSRSGMGGGGGAEADEGRALAKDAADDRGRGGALPAPGGDEGRGLGLADGDEQAPGRLGVVEERFEVLARGLVAPDKGGGVFTVALDGAGDDAVADEIEDAGGAGGGGAVDLDLDPA